MGRVLERRGGKQPAVIRSRVVRIHVLIANANTAADATAQRGKESDAKPAKGGPQPSKRSPGKGEPSDTAAKRGSGDGVKSSSGRAATKQTATKQKDPSDKRAGKAAERGSDEATPGRKPRKSDAAIKAANNRTGRE